MGGYMTFSKPISPEDAARAVLLQAAEIAEQKETPFDPFNVMIDVRPQGRKYKKC
jgi:hypothetical protein